MPTMVNPRSLALLNANPRLLTSPNSNVFLSASTPVFHINNSGVNDPAIITFNAFLIAMEGTVTFSCVGGTLSNIVGNTCALNYVNMTDESATVTATITYRNQVYTSSVEVSKVYDGQNGVVGMNNAIMYAYQRSATTPAGTPGAVEYSFPAAGITTATLANGWQKTIPSGTNKLWITAASAASSSSTDTVAANEWTTAVVLAENGTQGTNGINSATVTIYRRTATTTAPTLPTAATTYTFTPAGLTGLNNSWTTTIPAASGGAYLWASTATASSTSATDSIAASEWAAAQMLAQDGSKGDTGSRGNVQVARAIPGSVWSDSEAALAISGAGYGTPITRDVVTLYNSAAGYSQAKYYDGDSWEVLAAYFNGGLIVDGTVLTNALAAESVTATKIDARSLNLKDAAGNITFAANVPFAQQARISPNLVPNVRAWKYTAGGAAAFGNSANTANGEYIDLPAATAGTHVALETDIFVPAVGGTFTLSCLAASVTAGGNFVLDITGNPSVDTAGISVSPAVGALQRYTTTFTLPANTSGLRIRCFTSSGKNVQVADIKLEAGSNATAWTSNVITPATASTFIHAASINFAHIDRASITNLSALNSYLGSVEIGPGGNIRQGMTDYAVGVGMWMGQHNGLNKFIVGDPNGSMIWWDGYQLQTQKLNVQSFTLSAPNGGWSGSGTTAARNLGTRGVTVGGTFVGPMTYQWSVAGTMSANGYNHQVNITSGTTGSTVTLSATTYNMNDLITADVVCTVTDTSTGISKSIALPVSHVFGTGAA